MIEMIRTSTKDVVRFMCSKCGTVTKDLTIKGADQIIKDIQAGKRYLIICKCSVEREK